ncbi:LPS biosynthesis protein [Bordetella avium]|uniref:glutamine--fructose-6-phosphate transaminase (isomerizing) n=1 Tax=Bordetella avium (strain 197N) TaxID=360910 RepID=Q2L1U1_BORA1|nr:LPS biosynthesis protein [Bordetella avium]RIQ53863.1 hypothetical protein D0843_06425 [Bordetella avium]RIQ74280.1 hypothetical protein D0838_03425 [Bordetella avium]CAJ47689.1 putative lipopolysaccharide biosynthesis protein [Bordetella avium 197N]
MCGIFGLVVARQSTLKTDDISKLLKRLFLLSESRGKEAAGLAAAAGQTLRVLKYPVPASELLKMQEYKRQVEQAVSQRDQTGLGIVGHARLVTNGQQGVDANNQPVVRDSVVVVHNGIIVNEAEIWAAEPRLKKLAQVDTEVVAALMNDRLARGAPIEQVCREVFGKIYGEASLGVLFADRDDLLLATNTGSLNYLHAPKQGVFVFVSEYVIAKRIREEMKEHIEFGDPQPVRAGQAMTIRIESAQPGPLFSLGLPYSPAETAAPILAAPAPVLRKVVSNVEEQQRRYAGLRRCSKCVLPETMPFIEFDEQGVCNYCNNYKPAKLKGRKELDKLLEKYRSNNGSADCLVGFSGGRDSSYGLHLLKTELGMNPIAYTYDWGMVTDLARRNQARLCGKLGVEHIWVSADIKQKRANVGVNVNAWLKNPDLGMIPLFMAGDKQFMYHANRLMKETGIKLMVYSTNHLERTDFKVGFCGVRPASAGVQLNKVSSMQKAQLALYYMKNYLVNPGYINQSLLDTFTAFLSYYFVNQDFLYLFDYLEWDEATINKVLIETYDWELAPDTPTTWRIGDGTAPFYNYIYQTVAGFTEYETFRSNQIREGVITREEAFMLIEKENIARIDAIQDYCRLIGVDFDKAMRVINSIPKLY